MFFRAFGIPTTVQVSFWLGCLMFGFRTLQGPYPHFVLLWAIVVFVSVLIHELGHAFAMLRYGLQPEITLYMFGGLTATRGMGNLKRRQRIFISLAGPLAGFIFGGLVLVADMFIGPPRGMSEHAQLAILNFVWWLKYVNLGWGMVNLIPVIPLDGGHVLEDLFGPRRERVAYKTMIVAAVIFGLLSLKFEIFLITALMAIGGYQAYQKLEVVSAATRRVDPHRAPPPVETIPDEVQRQLSRAKEALADERFDEAGTLAELALGERPPKAARVEALHVLAWAHLLQSRRGEAERVLKAIAREGEPDLALVGALLFDKGETEPAREVFQAARAAGDDRKEIVGPLIQILIGEGEVARAAAIAFDVVETLNDEDVRQMAAIAYEREAYQWASRLFEALFERTEDPQLGYEAVRAMSLHGDAARALALLRRAVAAGYSDAAKVWSDKALDKLRSVEETQLEDILPRATER
jgi:Zn-dependent protease